MDAIRHAVDFVMAQPSLFLIAPSDWRELPKVLEAATSSSGSIDYDLIRSDIERLSIQPLFDGATMEKI